jgi:geranylgeranyl pyrophosphate synthase
LFSQAARIGAHFAGAPPQVVEAMRRFGFEIGVGFQMVDDLLDVVGPVEVIGKPVGGDLREGIPALPIVLGLPSLPELAIAFAAADAGPEAVAAGLAALRRSNVLGKVRELAARHVRLAGAQLGLLPDSAYRDALTQFTSDLIDRTS